MLPRIKKIRKNSRVILFSALLLATLVAVITPEPAHAYSFPSGGPAIGGGTVCPNSGSGLTRRIVPCVKDNIVGAVNNFLLPMSIFMADAVNAACLLAIAIGGIWVVSGRVNAALRDMTILFLKVGFVLIFTWNFGGMFGLFLDILDELLMIAGSYAIWFSSLLMNTNCPPFSSGPMSLWVWEQVDCAIETLVGGIFSPFTLAMGIAGFLFGCLFSSTAGMFIGLMGFFIVIQFLYACARATYTFISAYIAFSIMVLISPLFIPCILFRVTKPYFDKWLRLTISFILQPMIVFAYVSMLLAAVDQVIFVGDNSIYVTVAGNAATAPGFEFGAYMLGTGAYSVQPMGGQTVGVDPRRVFNELGAPIDADSGAAGHIGDTIIDDAAAWRDNIYQYMGLGDGSALRFFRVDWPTNGIDWEWMAIWDWVFNNGADPFGPNGVDPTAYMIKLFTSFFMAAVVVYIFLTLLDSLPFLSAGIAGVPAGMPTLGSGSLAPPGSNLMETFRTRMQSLGGGG